MVTAEKIAQLAASNSAPNASSAADKIGNGIITMLKQTTQAARETADRAVRTSQRLEEQLQQSEERVKRLEAEVKQSQERALAAENWLCRIQKETQESFARFQTAQEPQDTVPQRKFMLGQ